MSDEELIRGYFNKTLLEEDSAIFQEKYNSDLSFKTMANQIELEILAFRDLERDEIKSKFDSWDQEEPKTITINWKILSGVAAALIIAFSVIFFSDGGKTNEELFAENYTTYENYEVTSLRNDIKEDKKSLAYRSYDKRNFREAAKKFKSLESLTRADQFFLAISYIELNDVENSELLLVQIIDSEVTTYTPPARWYLSLLYIKNNQTDKAIELLELLNSDQEYGQKSKSILKELRTN